jgi:hypothetical protein
MTEYLRVSNSGRAVPRHAPWRRRRRLFATTRAFFVVHRDCLPGVEPGVEVRQVRLHGIEADFFVEDPASSVSVGMAPSAFQSAKDDAIMV